MALGIEDRPAVSDVHVVPRRGRHVRVLGQAALVDALRGLDDLVQARRDLGRGHAAAEDVAGGDGGAVEVLVRVLALDEHRALEREPGEESCAGAAWRRQSLCFMAVVHPIRFDRPRLRFDYRVV